MKFLKYIFVNITGTLLRGFPLPCKTGLIRIGNPDKDSTVFLTGNYYVTMERVKRVLEKNHIDCFLLIANSRGINVWCSAAGGHFTNNDVISVLKTSGIEQLVNHRNVILPQLASAGIEGKVIKNKVEWDIIWGPVYAKDIPDYINTNFNKMQDMREIKFPLIHRMEMGVMWAFPFSIIVAFTTFFFWPKVLLPLTILTWILPFLIFILFPLYSGLLNPRRKGASLSRYTVIFDFARVPLILVGIFTLCVVLYSVIIGTFSLGFILFWSFVSFVLTLLVSIDLMGSTPVYKSGLHEERLLNVKLYKMKCTGCGICKDVCPRDCYDIDELRSLAVISRTEKCVQCAACIVQCHFDALYFESPEGGVIYPEIIRKFKLNLLGSRFVKGMDKSG